MIATNPSTCLFLSCIEIRFYANLTLALVYVCLIFKFIFMPVTNLSTCLCLSDVEIHFLCKQLTLALVYVCLIFKFIFMPATNPSSCLCLSDVKIHFYASNHSQLSWTCLIGTPAYKQIDEKIDYDRKCSEISGVWRNSTLCNR